MRNPFLNLALILVVCHSVALGQNSPVAHQLVDASNGAPVPFANIAVKERNVGAISDINGMYSVNGILPSDTIQISCIGYRPQFLTLGNLKPIVKLIPQPYDLASIDVFPGKNKAVEIMEKVIDRRNQNNPDKVTDYKCVVYHKMNFRYLVPDSVGKDSVARKKIPGGNGKFDLLLIESVSEKKHLRPNKNSEALISGRVSGMNDPVLAILPAQIQPFTFYDETLSLIGKQFLNPMSPAGIRNYVFIIEDTLFDVKGDTLFYISFFPKKQANISGVKGTFHVHQPTWAIKNVTATTVAAESPYVLSIKQNYRQLTDSVWFPEQLESSLVINSLGGSSKIPYPMLAEGKSYVTGVDVNPSFDKRDFSATVLSDKTNTRESVPIEAYRCQQLTRKDSMTYHIIDSVGQKAKLDRLVAFEKNLIQGYIPVGKMKLDYRKLIDYTSFEGLKLGVGLMTGEQISRVVETGGYFVHAYGVNENAYGGTLKFNLSPEYQSSVGLSYDNAFSETGSVAFVDGFGQLSPESFKKYMTETMDRTREVQFNATSRLGGGFKARFIVSRFDKQPQIAYRFSTGGSLENGVEGTSASVQLRWKPGETYTFSPLGLFPNITNGPVFWANAGYCHSNRFSFYRSEAQVEYKVAVNPAHTSIFRATGGQMWGNYNTSFLYSAFGAYEKIGVDIPHAFATMRLNEFAADRFVNLSWLHEWALNQNSNGKFKPILKFSSKAGWGNFNAANLVDARTISSYKKGFFESGLALHNLFHQSFIQYGLGAYYRYGPYALPNWQQNIAVKLVVEFAL